MPHWEGTHERHARDWASPQRVELDHWALSRAVRVDEEGSLDMARDGWDDVLRQSCSQMRWDSRAARQRGETDRLGPWGKHSRRLTRGRVKTSELAWDCVFGGDNDK